MVDKLKGKWRLEVTSNSFDEYLQHIGVSILNRKTMMAVTPDVAICRSANEWTLSTTIGPTTNDLRFRLGQEFDERRADGKVTKSTFQVEDGKLVQTQAGVGTNGEDAVITREINPDGKMLVTLSVGHVVASRIFGRIS